jgi:hypothetical protein
VDQKDKKKEERGKRFLVLANWSPRLTLLPFASSSSPSLPGLNQKKKPGWIRVIAPRERSRAACTSHASRFIARSPTAPHRLAHPRPPASPGGRRWLPPQQPRAGAACSCTTTTTTSGSSRCGPAPAPAASRSSSRPTAAAPSSSTRSPWYVVSPPRRLRECRLSSPATSGRRSSKCLPERIGHK